MAHLYIHESNQIKTVEFTPPALLSELLSHEGAPLDMPCGGKGRCKKCEVQAWGALSAPDAREAELPGGVRFACMTSALGDVHVSLEKKTGDRIVTDGSRIECPLLPWAQGIGAAIDVGTTTVAAYLYDLSDGSLITTAAERNPQGPFGADVISRLEKSLAGEGEALREVIENCIHSLVKTMAGDKKVDALVVTGNTAMMYLLTGRNPSSITAAPFEMDCTFGEFVEGNMRTYLPRCISAYVGADITCAMLANGFFAGGSVPQNDTRLLVDIGTNGEMGLITEGKILCCSTAAGPAFEGAGIYMGMTARPGAISKVAYENGSWHIETIGGVPAQGLCGSGLIDAVACMLDAGVLDETGVIDEESHSFTDCVTEADDQLAFRLPGTEVVLTQKDIRAVQLAKSAICAGMKTLLATAQIEPESVRELIVAGGFGSKLDVFSAERIGLLPEGFAKKARAVGNAAGAGASMLLLNQDMLRQSEELAKVCQTIELSGSPLFMEHYVENMMFNV